MPPPWYPGGSTTLRAVSDGTQRPVNPLRAPRLRRSGARAPAGKGSPGDFAGVQGDGGGDGIRTREGLRPTRFPGVRLEPLGHPSVIAGGREPSECVGCGQARMIKGPPAETPRVGHPLPRPSRRHACRRAAPGARSNAAHPAPPIDSTTSRCRAVHSRKARRGTGMSRCVQSASLRAARKASWGISTLPNWRIRFFPLFWRSSSLRLRLTSPP